MSNSTNTSATGGYLPLTGGMDNKEQTGLLHGLITGLTGLTGDRVRPRWLFEPAFAPVPSETWAAFGLQKLSLTGAPQIRHSGLGEGRDVIVSHEELLVLVTFIGPECMERASLLRDGLYVPQNTAPLRPAGMVFVRAGDMTPLPQAVGGHWLARMDLSLVFRRATEREIPVLNLACCASQGAFLENDTGVTVGLCTGNQSPGE